MASSLLMVDRPPFVDRHSLLKRVTFRAETGDWPVKRLSWASCDVAHEVLGKLPSWYEHYNNYYSYLQAHKNIFFGIQN